MSQAAYEVVAHPAAQRELDHLPPEGQDRLRAILKAMAVNREPAEASHTEVLSDCKHSFYRCRANRWRAIVGFDSPQLILLACGHRDNFYQEKLPVAERRFERGGGQ